MHRQSIHKLFGNIWLAPLISGGAVFCLLLYYHNIFWFAPDEGVYAHWADLINQGKIHGVDYHALRPGYHSFLNAFLFDTIDRDLVVMRYPLIILGALQAGMVAYMLRHQGPLFSFIAAIWVCCFSFLQFLNPSSSWYVFHIAFMCIFVLAEMPKSVWRLILTGFLLGLCIGFRHPSAVFLGAGLLVYVIFEIYNDQTTPPKYGWFGQLLLLCILIGLSVYSLGMHGDLSLFVYLGIWPIIMCLIMMKYYRVADSQLFKACAWIGLGCLIAIAPLFIYQYLYGDIFVWLDTLVGHPNYALGRDFFHSVRYWQIPFDYSYYSIFGFFYGLLVYLLVPLAGFKAVQYLYHQRDGSVHPAIIIPMFFGFVSLYYQIPFYLFISFTLFGLSLLVQEQKSKVNSMIIMAIMSIYTLTFHVGKLLPEDNPDTHTTIEGADLYVDNKSAKTYRELLEYIKTNTSQEDAIFAYPHYPELYFLSRRPNPTPYISSAVSVNTPEDYKKWVNLMKSTEPKLIITNPDDKYFGTYEEQLTALLTSDLGYNLVAEIKPFVVYKKDE